MDEEPSRYVAGALISGPAAEVLDGLLASRHVAEMLAAVTARDPQLGNELEAMRRAVRLAAVDSAACRVSGDGSESGSAETHLAVAAAPSEHEIDVREASRILGVTDRRARQLAAGGLGYQVGGRWRFDRALVVVEAERRRAG